MAVSVARMNRAIRQRGVALITALLVVALATVAAVAMASRQQLDIRRTANLLDSDQAYAYALAVEGWARVILQRDRRDNETDHLDETWAQRLPPIGVPGGQIDGFIVDLQGRFNLNNLVTPEGKLSEPDYLFFQRLLRILELNETLAMAVADWLDSDFDTRFPEGAEDDFYMVQDARYRTANRPLQSVSELRLVRGVDAKTWRTLAPYVSALPVRTPLNVNTAAAPLLQALADDLSEQDAESLVEARGDDGFDTVDMFLQQEVFAGRPLAADGVAVSSQYFLVRSLVDVGTARAQVFSVVERNPQVLVTLARTRGTW